MNISKSDLVICCSGHGWEKVLFVWEGEVLWRNNPFTSWQIHGIQTWKRGVGWGGNMLWSELTNSAEVLGLCHKHLCLEWRLTPRRRPASFVGLNCIMRSFPQKDLLSNQKTGGKPEEIN